MKLVDSFDHLVLTFALAIMAAGAFFLVQGYFG